MKYVVTCKNMSLTLDLPEEVALTVRDLIFPYFSFKPLPEPWKDTGGWQIGLWQDSSSAPAGHERFTLATDVERELSYFFAADRRSVFLCRGALNDGFVAQNIMRLARVILRLSARDAGELFAHGGLISLQGRGVAIIGDKRAGKTTTILSCLQAGATYLTNDDVSFRLEADELKAYGWPRSISVRGDNLQNLSKKNNLNTFYDQLNHPGNAIVRQSDFEGLEPKQLVFFQPTELVNMFSSTLHTSCRLDAVIFPEFTEDRQHSPELIPLAPEEGLSLLASHLVRNPGKYNEFLLPAFDSHDPEGLFPAYQKHFARLPMFRLRQGFAQVHQTPARLLNALQGRGNA